VSRTHRLITLRMMRISATRNDHEYCIVKKTAHPATVAVKHGDISAVSQERADSKDVLSQLAMEKRIPRPRMRVSFVSSDLATTRIRQRPIWRA
jgi:hypothetical protein